MTRWLSALIALAVLGIATPARASNGFVLGFEFGGGPWTVNPAQLSSHSQGQGVSLAEAQGFANPMTAGWVPDLNLHLGWNILGHVAIEGVFQATGWDLLTANRGGGGLAGARVAWFPFQTFFPKRIFDASIELGGGYSLLGGPAPGGSPTFGVAGGYFQFGLTAEIYVVPSVSFEAFYRFYDAFWNKFYTDYNNNKFVPLTGFSAPWNVIGVGINFHVG